jgi:hemoglobin
VNPAGESGQGQPPTFYDAIGGEPAFRKLVGEFYAGVATDPLLRPMYPEADLGPAADRLALFLMQYWGGPSTYSARRGHPRLRMRHASFRVGPAERDAWLHHMRRAVDSLGLPEEHESTLWQYLERAAYFMVNTLDDTGSGPGQPAAAEPRSRAQAPELRK